MNYLGAGAQLSPDELYRYELTRRWDEDLPRACFVMLNPSTADGLEDDPTIRKCVGFASRAGFGSLSVVNLYAWRATDPRQLQTVASPVGEHNDAMIELAVRGAGIVIAAWGSLTAGRRAWQTKAIERSLSVLRLLTKHGDVHALRITASGRPEHPLYLPGDSRPVIYRAKGAA